jgi:hypothetical protein
VIVRNLNVVGIVVSPHEADAVSVVDANAVLACAVAAQDFKAISGWNQKIFQDRGSVKHLEFLQRRLSEACRNVPRVHFVPQPLGIGIPEALDHASQY